MELSFSISVDKESRQYTTDYQYRYVIKASNEKAQPVGCYAVISRFGQSNANCHLKGNAENIQKVLANKEKDAGFGGDGGFEWISCDFYRKELTLRYSTIGLARFDGKLFLVGSPFGSAVEITEASAQSLADAFKGAMYREG